MKYLLAWLVLLGIYAQAQVPNYSFEYISNRDGLPSNVVNSAYEDTKGFLWLATRRCLTRYDGYSFKNFKTGNTWDVTADNSNNIFYTTDTTQLSIIHNYSQTPKTLVGNKEGGSISIFRDSDGNLWFSDRFGINKYDIGKRKNYFYPLKKTTFLWHKGYFVEDSEKNVWILGFEVGLFKFDKKNNRLICKAGLDCTNKDFRENNNFSRGFIDKQNIIWAATFDNGLFRYDTQQNSIRYIQLPNAESCVSVCESVDENNERFFWIGTDKRIGVYYPRTDKFFFFDNILPFPFTVYKIFKSPKTGIVWFCTNEGLIKYNPNNQTIKTNLLPNSLHPTANNVHAFLKDNNHSNVYWLGLSRGGLLKWNKADNSTKYFPYPAFSTKAETNWLIYDNAGKMIIGTNQWQSWADGKTDSTDNQFEGVFRFDTQTERFQDLPFKVHHRFFSVPFYSLGLVDSKNRLWLINHYEGIRIIDLQTNKKVDLWPNSEHEALMKNYTNWITAIFEDSSHRIWIGTLQGIFYFDETQKKFISIEAINKTKLNEKGILNITEDKKGYLWATGWHLLIKFDKKGKVLGQWTEKDGIYDAESRKIAIDETNRIWLGTFDGLHSFDENHKAFRRFTVNDGLLSNNTISGLYQYKNDLLIGNRGGWNLVNLEKLNSFQEVDNLAISSIKVNNQEYKTDWSQEVFLDRNQNAISFDFSALNYLKPNDNRYSYYLEGLENTWIDAQNNHQISYNNLLPNSYILHIRSANAFGKWNQKEVLVRFSIQPAYYETWWFKLLIMSLFLGIIYIFYRYRINQILKLQAIRENISRDLHDEIGASLSGIGILGQIATQKLEKTHPSYQHLERITQDAKNIGASMDDIVWSINPQNDGLENIIARMNRHASELLEAKDINYQLITEIVDVKLKLSMEQRRDVFLIFKEAINNLLKYAHCQNVIVEVKAQNKLFEMKVIDDGRGIEQNQQTQGNGLKNMNNRAENLGGKLNILSKPNEGTTIHLLLPL